jgi:type VI secretion system protein ImpC
MGTVFKAMRVRRPRAHLVYEVEEAGSTRLRELPMVIGVLGNFSGDPHREPPPERRPFLHVDRDNFHEVLRQISPALTLEVEDLLGDGPGRLSFRLAFRALEDFGPEAIVRQVQPLAALVAQREALLREGSPVAEIEGRICRQLRAILRAPEFQRLEGAWRGLHLLVTNSETSAVLKIKVLDLSKEELAEDLAQAVEPDQSQLFRRVCREPFGTLHGEPFGALLGDYEFSHQPDEVALLGKISELGSIAFCPFISSASPRILGIDSWSQLRGLGRLEMITRGAEYSRWNALRSSEIARFVYLTVPRVLSRLPYDARLAQGFGFEEIDPGERHGASPPPSHLYCWTSVAYVLGMRLADSFAKAGHCLAICGNEGGRVEGLPGGVAIRDDGELDHACPTEIGITRRRADQFSFLGLMPLWHPKDEDHAMLGGSQSIQKLAGLPEEAVFDALLTGHLRYVMAISRFAQYLMLIARDKFAESVGPDQCQEALERWIAAYVGACGPPGPEMSARFPLQEAKIEVRHAAGKPERYEIVAWLQPWLPDLQLTHAQRITMQVPCGGPAVFEWTSE